MHKKNNGGKCSLLSAAVFHLFFLAISLTLCMAPAVLGKGIHITMVAPWKETALLQEGCEWLAANAPSDGAFFSCVRRVWSRTSPDPQRRGGALALSQKLQLDLLLELARDFRLRPTQRELLRMALALRLYAPAVAAHAQLAESAARGGGGCAAERRPFAVLGGAALCEEKALEAALDAAEKEEEKGKGKGDNGEQAVELFPGLDHVHPGSAGERHVVLYGILGEVRTMRLLSVIERYLKSVRFAFRHLPLAGASLSDGMNFTESLWDSALFVQGYGVTVDLKNVEYKAMDDKEKHEKEKTLDASKEKLTEESATEEKDLGGFDMRLIRSRYKELSSKLKGFEEYMIDAVGNEEVKVDFHMWETKHMGIAAVQYVMKADNADRLSILQEILTRFPLYASTLSRRGATAQNKMSDKMRRAQDKLSEFIQPGAAEVFLNGRHIEQKSRDIFSLLKGIERDEQLFVKMSTILESCGVPEISGGESDSPMNSSKANKFLQRVMHTVQREGLSSQNKDLKPRLLFPHRGIYWINDIENDSRYSDFHRALSSILTSDFYGSPNMPRKNLFHVVCVIDPTETFGIQVMKMLTMLIMRQAPFRVGVVLLDKAWKPTVSGTINADGTGMIMEPALSTVTLCIAGVLWELGLDKSSDKFEFLHSILELEQEHNTLSEESVRTAAEAALKGARRRVLDDVLTDDLFLQDYQWTQERIRALELTNERVTFVNGMRFTGDVMSALQKSFMSEVTTLREFVQKGDLRDDITENLYDVIMKLHGAKERYRASIYDKRRFADWGSEHIVHFLQHWPFLLPSSLANPENADLFISSVLVLRGPMTELSYRAIALTSQYLHDCQGADSVCSQTRSTHVICNAHEEKDRKTAKDIDRLLWAGRGSLVADYIESVLQQKEPSSAVKEVLLAEARDLSANQSTALHASLRDAFCSAMSAGSLSPVELFVNGRRVPWEADFDARDLDDLFGAARAFAAGAWGAVAKASRGRDGAAPAKAAALAAVLAADAEENGPRAEREALPAEKAVAEGLAFAAGPRDGTDARHQLTVAIDPIARQSQSVISLCDYMARAPIGARCLVYMNPSVNIDKPTRNFYNFVADTALHFDAAGRVVPPAATFHRMPIKHLLTLGTEEPEGWTVFPMEAKYDLDNVILSNLPPTAQYLTAIYRINSILITGGARIEGLDMPPRGLPLMIRSDRESHVGTKTRDTLVMTNFGYFQLQGAPGVWYLGVQPGDIAKAFRITDIGGMSIDSEDTINYTAGQSIPIVVSSFVGNDLSISLANTPGYEHVRIEDALASAVKTVRSEWPPTGPRESRPVRPTINIYTVASGHLYERFLRMMMHSVMQTSSDVHGANTTRIKFWLIENFLSPQFKETVPLLAEHYGFDVGFVTYRWPWWLRKQTEKQRIIWGYKILFLDVLFPLDVDRVIFVDADQALRADLHELYNMDIGDAPTAYTPFCSKHPNEATRNFRFWDRGFWESHLRGKPYHISAIYLVNLHRLRAIAGGDTYRVMYSRLSQDPQSLSNLDQDLPNYLQDHVPIFSLPEEWLWCETWCSADSKKNAKTIDLCNNPLTKTPKLENAKIIIEGWEKTDAELEEVSKRLLERSQTY